MSWRESVTHVLAPHREEDAAEPRRRIRRERDRPMEDSTARSHFTPEGWHTLTPRIVAPEARKLVEFLNKVFGATGEYARERPSVIQIGDSLVMISHPGIRGPSRPFSTCTSATPNPLAALPGEIWPGPNFMNFSFRIGT